MRIVEKIKGRRYFQRKRQNLGHQDTSSSF
jgi:hypothetical protein